MGKQQGSPLVHASTNYTASASFFFRFELLDVVHLPSSVKFAEQPVLQYLSRFARDRWAASYKTIEFRPLWIGGSVLNAAGTSRSALPVFISLREWLAFADTGGNSSNTLPSTSGGAASGSSAKKLHLGSTYKKALWFRFAVELHSLQTSGFIREAIKLFDCPVPSSSSEEVTAASPGLTRKAFELALIEFRVFALLLWLQAFRQARLSLSTGTAARAVAVNAANSEASPRGAAGGGVLAGSGAGSSTLLSQPASRVEKKTGSGAGNSAPLGSSTAALSPRQQRRTDFLTSAKLEGTTHEEAFSMVKDAFLDSMQTILLIIGFHFDSAISLDASSTPTHVTDPHTCAARLTSDSTGAEPALSAHHLKYLALLLQLRQSVEPGGGGVLGSSRQFSQGGKKMPTSSKVLETTLFSEFTKHGVVNDSQMTPLISIQSAGKWLRAVMAVSLASTDIWTSSIFNSNSLMSFSPTLESRRSKGGPASPHSPQPIVDGGSAGYCSTSDEGTPAATAKSAASRRIPVGIGRHRSSSSDHYLVVGKRRDVCVVTASQLDHHYSDLTLMDCTETTVYALTGFRNVKLIHCKNCVVILPCVSASTLILYCRNLAIHVAGVGLVIANSYDIDVYTLCVTPPTIAGDSRDISMGPYNVVMSGQREYMRAVGFDFDANTLNGFTTSLIVPLSGGGRSGGANPLVNGAATPRDDPSFRNKPRPGSPRAPVTQDVRALSGTAEENVSSNLLNVADFSTITVSTNQSDEEEVCLVLPEIYAEALKVKKSRKQKAVLDFLHKLKSFKTNREKDLFLQKVEQRFGEWLQRCEEKHYAFFGPLCRHHDSDLSQFHLENVLL